MEHAVNGYGVTANVRRNPATGAVTVTGRLDLLGPAVPQIIDWIAAAPVTRGISFAGSGQPYPNKHIALEGTPNKGRIDSPDGSFTLTLKDIPAGYYSGLGSLFVPPTIEFMTQSRDGQQRRKTVLAINDTAAPYRWLNGSPATQRFDPNTPTSTGRAMYYGGRESLPIPDTQEALLRAKAYPGDMTARGWPESEDAKPWIRVPAPA